MKIINLDGNTTNPGDLSWEWLEKYGEYKIYERTSESEILERAADADILILNKTPVLAGILKKLPKLKYIGLQSTGYNVVDCAAAKELGIVVSNIPEYSTCAVAQLTFALILELSNNVGMHSKSVYDNEWCLCKDFCYWKAPLWELSGKTIGIIGFGKIGRSVAEIAESFGMNVLAYSPSPKEKGNLKTAVFTDINDILKNADVITLHCPLTPKTEKLINEEAISMMKPNAVIINTARGPVIDEYALAAALNSGKIAGAGLDVLSVEPCKEDNPLLKAKNCFITPHIAWAGYETRSRLMKILEENLIAFLEGKPKNVVNK